MFASVKKSWKEFKALEPGSRFLTTFENNQRDRASAWKRVAFIVVGLVLTLVGVVALVAPGPGLLISALGLALIARESATLSRALDRLEVFGRRQWDRLQKWRGERAK